MQYVLVEATLGLSVLLDLYKCYKGGDYISEDLSILFLHLQAFCLNLKLVFDLFVSAFHVKSAHTGLTFSGVIDAFKIVLNLVLTFLCFISVILDRMK
jgi:hypothetical protein